MDFDTWIAGTICTEAARLAQVRSRVASLVLPTLPFGPTPEHRGFGSGYIDIPQSLFESLLNAILRSLVEQGFRRVVFWRGCGGHEIGGVIERCRRTYPEVEILVPDQPYHAIWCRLADAGVAGGHADSFTTSIALYLRPDAVRVDRIPPPETLPVPWDDPALDFARYSRSGVIGDATHAGAELGARLWEAVVDHLVERLAEFINPPSE